MQWTFGFWLPSISPLSLSKQFIYLLAALGLHCCSQAFSSCGKQRHPFIVVHRLLLAMASLAVEFRLSCCSVQAPEIVGSVVVVRGL